MYSKNRCSICVFKISDVQIILKELVQNLILNVLPKICISMIEFETTFALVKFTELPS